MANTTNFSVRMDSEIKKQCKSLRQFLRVDGLPFDVRLEQPNKETIVAMSEAEWIARDSSVKHYSDVEEALRDLKR